MRWLAAGFGERLGKIISFVEVVIGLAAAGGSSAGGVLFSLGASTIFGSFLLPFVATFTCTILLIPLVLYTLPSRKLGTDDDSNADAGNAHALESGDSKSGSYSSIWTAARLATLSSLACGSSMVEAMFPTLPPELDALGFDAVAIGNVLSENALAYMLGAVMFGAVIDWQPTRRTRRMVMGLGWLLMGASYFTLGPMRSMLPAGSAGFVYLAMFAQGIASGGIIVPSLPDAQDGLEDEVEKATLCSVWNSCYSGGAAAGPIVAAALSSLYGFDRMCVIFVAWSLVSTLILLFTSTGGLTSSRKEKTAAVQRQRSASFRTKEAWGL